MNTNAAFPREQSRKEIVHIFRARLLEVIARSGLSRSAFAARVGTDRSTLSQLLDPEGTRLPRSETVVGIAIAARVSVDWLLGLSQKGQIATDVVAEMVAIEPGRGGPADRRLQAWQAEAAGYKIRYVPSTLPDLLKTEAVIRYEYVGHGEVPPEGRIEQAEANLAYSRRPETDLEVCCSWQSVEDFARGHGIWSKLAREHRLEQLESMIRLTDELYPTFRWFLYDALERFAAPYTVFGPLRAAVYVGDIYLVFNGTEHIRALIRHFEGLIRGAVMQPPEVLAYLQKLLAEAESEDARGPAPGHRGT